MDAIDAREPAFFFAGGSHACLLLHGFTGSPLHMRALGEALHQAGYTVYAPLLPGHGTSLADMEQTGWRDWLEAARESYRQLKTRCPVVTVAGLSMGGTLALLIAQSHPVDGVICFSPALKMRARFLWAARLIALFTPRYAPKREAPREDQGDAPVAGYDAMPVRCLYDLQVLAWMADRNLYAVTAPLLVMQPLQDTSVRLSGARRIVRDTSSADKTLIWLEKSRHNCLIGPELGEIVQAVLAHLRHIDDTASRR